MRPPRFSRRRLVLLALVVLCFGACGPFSWQHLRAASLLLRASGDRGWIARGWDTPIVEESLLLRSRYGTFRARLYRPRDGAPRRGLVLAHGVHYLGVDEPRLVPFARNLARSGAVVLTPELAALADYRVQASSVEELRVAVRHLARSRWVRSGGVGLMGLSFAGGLSLRAASEPTLQGDLAFVVSIGGHHDLARVCRFLATDTLETPEGARPMHAHDYGLVVLFYAYAQRFVPEAQRLLFQDALRLILQEKRPEALRVRAFLRDEARARFDRIVAHDKPALRPLVEAAMPALREVMAEGSPSGHLASVRAPVYLLHGVADDVIPAAEARFAARELAGHAPVHLLVTPAIKHVTVEGHPTWYEQWQIVHFMADLLDE